MEPIKIEKAGSLDSVVRAFSTEALDENTLPIFYYDQTMAIRTGDEWDSPLLDLYNLCTTPRDSNAHLLLGHRGCGKSTELNKLKQKIEASGQPVCIVNPMVEIDLFQVDHWDIMLLITVALCRIANDKGVKIHDEILKAIFELLKKDVEVIETTDDSSSVGLNAGVEIKTPPILSGVVKLFAGITADLKASQSSRTIIKEKIERRATDWINYTKEIADRITQGCNGKQPVLIFEEIDKLPNPGKAIDIFGNPPLAQMPFPIIYTFPISQFYSPGFATIRDSYSYHILPMIKVSNLDGSKNEEGIGVISEIVKRRSELRLFDDEALELLIQDTGGSLRDLFRGIIAAAERATRRGATRIEVEDAKRALSDLSNELTSQIIVEDYQLLEKIYCDPRYREQISDREFLLKKMQSLVILEYRNGGRWHDVHPLIAKFLIRQGVIDGSKKRK